jgi:hypothetical protein
MFHLSQDQKTTACNHPYPIFFVSDTKDVACGNCKRTGAYRAALVANRPMYLYGK